MDKALRELLDRQACEDLLLRYGRTLDWLDEAGQASCFWPDAEVDYGFFKGTGADWVITVMEVEKASVRRWHMTTGLMVRVDGDAAQSECYGIAAATAANDDGELIDTLFGGRYLDELEKRDGEWRISRRQYVADWVQQFPNGLDAAQGQFMLNVLQIPESGHGLYRPL